MGKERCVVVGDGSGITPVQRPSTGFLPWRPGGLEGGTEEDQSTVAHRLPGDVPFSRDVVGAPQDEDEDDGTDVRPVESPLCPHSSIRFGREREPVRGVRTPPPSPWSPSVGVCGTASYPSPVDFLTSSSLVLRSDLDPPPTKIRSPFLPIFRFLVVRDVSGIP